MSVRPLLRPASAVLFAAVLLPAGLAAQAAPTAADSAGVRKALQHYLTAHATGSPDEARAAFAPGATLKGWRDGKPYERSAVDYAAGFSGAPAADESRRRRSIDFIDIRGTAAVARITLDYPAVTFTDYMQLLKLDGEWKIVSKTFHAEPKPKP